MAQSGDSIWVYYSNPYNGTSDDNPADFTHIFASEEDCFLAILADIKDIDEWYWDKYAAEIVKLRSVEELLGFIDPEEWAYNMSAWEMVIE